MIAEFIIGFREALEVTVILGLILGFAGKTGKPEFGSRHYKGILAGVGLAIAASIATALAFESLSLKATGFEAVFEGVTMLAAAAVITWTLFSFNKRTSAGVKANELAGEKSVRKLAALSFLVTYREGFETVLFLNALAISAKASDPLALPAAAAGIIAAIAVGIAVYKTGLKLGVKKFFQITTAFLVLFAAGFFAGGIGELQEVSAPNFLAEKAWNTVGMLGIETPLGALLHAIVGYDDNPTVLKAIAYVGFLAAAVLALRKRKNRN